MTVFTEAKIERDHLDAAALARKLILNHTLILDTETTGLGPRDQIIEICIMDTTGHVLIESLVKPTIAIPAEVSEIHGITDDQVCRAPYLTVLLPDVSDLLLQNPSAIYNAEFDLKMLNQSACAHGTEFPVVLANRLHCIMKLYSKFAGVWDPRKQDYRWWKLAVAAGHQRISLPSQLHRARYDAELTRRLLHKMAEAV